MKTVAVIFVLLLSFGIANGKAVVGKSPNKTDLNFKKCREFVTTQKLAASSIMENKFDDILKYCGKDSRFYLQPRNNVFFGQLDGKEMRKITDKWASSCNKQKDMKLCLEQVNRKMTYLRIVNGGMAGQNSKERRSPVEEKTRNIASSRKKK